MTHQPRPVPSRRPPAVAGAVLGLLAGLITWFAAPVVDAQESATVAVDQIGWWSDRLAANEADEGGFEVSAAPDATVQGVAAFRMTVSMASVDSLPIVLEETAGLGAQLGSLELCTTTEDWEPANPGSLDDAPTPDCSTSVFLTHVGTEQTWIGDIADLAPEGGAVSVMVIPRHTPPTPLGTGMVIRVASIELDATGSSAPVNSTTSTTLDFTTPGGSNIFEPNPDSGFNGAPQDLDGSSDFAVDSPSAPEDGTGDTAPDGSTETPSDDGFFALDPVDSESAPAKPWARLAVIVPLSAGFGYGSLRGKQLLDARGMALGGPTPT